jgi:hypothetical protein
MVRFIFCASALVVSAFAVPVDVIRRGSQLPLTAYSDGQTILLGEIAYYVPSKPEVSYPNFRQTWRLTNTGYIRLLW